MNGPVPEGKRYSPFDPDEVHADMRADPVATWRNVMRQPYVLQKHQDCAVCVELRSAGRQVSSRRARFEFTAPELADLLGLPPSMRIVRMSVVDEPFLLGLVVESPDLPEVPDDQPTPPAKLKATEGS
ncbi:MAG TPA: hypothetical protein VF174_10010 [Micromonosporaceae bacterium]